MNKNDVFVYLFGWTCALAAVGLVCYTIYYTSDHVSIVQRLKIENLEERVNKLEWRKK